MPLYKRPDSDIWWVNISHPNHPRVRRSTGTADRVEAQRIHDEIKAELWKQPAIKGHTWGQAVLLWAEKPGRSESDILSMRKFARRYGDRSLAEVSRENLTEALKAFKTDGTYMRYRGRITAILNIAKEEGWLRDVPKLPSRSRKAAKSRDWITHEEWAKLHAELPEHMQAMAEFAVETGLRQANVLGLLWSQVDLERHVVWYEAEDMKGRRAISVPLSARAAAVLHAVKGQHPEFVFTHQKRKKNGGGPRKPVSEIKTAFQAACIRAGVGRINALGRYEGFTWHGLRHTWATWHIQNGTPLEVLQKLGGWADLRMVLLYAHHSPGYLAGFADNTRKPRE